MAAYKRKAQTTAGKYQKKAKYMAKPSRAVWERKGLSSGPTTSVFNTTGGTAHLTNIDAGLGRDGRIGNRLSVTSIDLKGAFAVNTAGLAAQTCRLFVICDKYQSDAAFPSVFGANGVLESASALSLYSLDQPDRFHVLYDQFVVLNKIDKSTATLNVKIPVPKSLVSSFATNLGTTISRNGIYLMVVGDVGANAPTITFTSRISWTDY